MSHRAKNRGWAIVLGLGFFLSACDQTEACKKAPECARQGKCSANPNGACIVGSDKDCEDAEPCKLHGKCAG